jgi:hypothetical protein
MIGPKKEEYQLELSILMFSYKNLQFLSKVFYPIALLVASMDK